MLDDARDSLGVFSLCRVKTRAIMALCRKSVVT